MKQVYIFALSAMVFGSLSAATPHFTAKSPAKALKLGVAKAPAPLWRPASQTEYIYIDGEWHEDATVEFTYDGRGNAVTELITSEDGLYKTEKTYDEYNKVLTSVTTVDYGSQWENMSRTTYTYDDVLHGYATERMGYTWTDGAWVENYRCETNTISRNAAGNITDIVKALPLGDVMLPGYKLSWSYDNATGQADGMIYYSNPKGTENGWEIYDDTEYRNIVWAKTNGQMTEADINSYVEGDNLISSCEVYYDGILDGHFIVTYDADGGYTANQTYPDPTKVGYSVVKKFTGDNGSYSVTMSQYFDDNGDYKPKPTSVVRFDVLFNDHGDVVSETFSMVDGDYEEVEEGYTYEYTYDENGNITEYRSNLYDYDTDRYVPDTRITYSGYSQISGIGDIVTGNDIKAEYFDLQGRRVANPAKGIYIVRRGSEVRKIAL